MAISKVKENSITDAAVTNDKIASGVSASKLTGALPAISGANLTGVSQFTPPTISSFTPTSSTDASSAISVTITGTGFQEIPKVEFRGRNGAVTSASTVTYSSSTSIVATVTAGTLSEGNYKIIITNPDGIAVTASSEYQHSASPVWVTSSGSLGNAVRNLAIVSGTLVGYAGDADSTAITYTETTSVLTTANAELETFQENGYYKFRVVSSASTVTPDSVTTYTFTVRATDSGGTFTDREFSFGTIANTDPVFDTASGSIGSIPDSLRSSYSLSPVTATDAEGNTLTYSVSSGSLPSGLSLNTSTGAITGTASAVGSDTTSNFSITVEDGVGGSATRAFSIDVLAPVTLAYTSGTGTFDSPFTGNIKVLVVGGGGGGGQGHSGGGGAGGLISHPSYSVTSGTSYNYSIGAGHPGQPSTTRASDTTFGTGSGTDSTFLTAIGGGSGGGSTPGAGTGNADGGSGGGKDHAGAPARGQGIQTTSPAISADSKTYGFGNNGGTAPYVNPQPSGGGGGAGGAGQDGGGNVGGNGGASKNVSSDFGTTYGQSGLFAGGGGGGTHLGGSGGSGGGAGAGNGRGTGNSGPGQAATVANTGSGGGSGAAGAAGIIVIKY